MLKKIMIIFFGLFILVYSQESFGEDAKQTAIKANSIHFNAIKGAISDGVNMYAANQLATNGALAFPPKLDNAPDG